MPPRSRLFPCPHCRRHLRRDETTCPFCETALGPQPGSQRRRLGQTAWGVAMAGAVVACGAGQTDPQTVSEYGPPPYDDSADPSLMDPRDPSAAEPGTAPGDDPDALVEPDTDQDPGRAAEYAPPPLDDDPDAVEPTGADEYAPPPME